jgi:hypothetical protein
MEQSVVVIIEAEAAEERSPCLILISYWLEPEEKGSTTLHESSPLDGLELRDP